MREQPKKQTLKSLNMAEHKREQLKQLFPEVFDEGGIDFDALKSSLGECAVPVGERFGLSWHGKAACKKTIQQPSIATLKPNREQSVEFDETENLFIEGDNLEVLKLLQKSYFGKVKMIYIDPPYNTGKEFIYPDKYGETLNTYLEYTGQKDSEGRKFSTNTESEGRYHSNWLNMMYPRLYLARNLLREDGVIFISIDDNEQDNLKKLCNEIFGEENFIVQMVRRTINSGKHDVQTVATFHEYAFVYTKNSELVNFNQLSKTEEEKNNLYPLTDEYESERGRHYVTQLNKSSIQYSDSLNYPIEGPDGKEIWPGKGFNDKKWCWRWSSKKLEWGIKNYFIEFKKHGNSYKVYTKSYEFVDNQNIPITRGNPYSTLEFIKKQYANFNATPELARIFDNQKYFDFPKPISLLYELLKLTKSEESIILDFFAGSATTAHAVMQLNAEDGGNRKYICVQLPEPCDEKTEAHKAGYQTIADIGRERIRRAAKKIAAEKDAQKESQKRGEKLDLGFKAFSLAPSNFAVWESDVDKIDNLEKQLELHADHIDPSSSSEDILYELLLKSGFALTAPIETMQLAGKQVFSVNADNGSNHSNALLICLEKQLTQKLMDAIADKNPAQVICLDAGFQSNDQLKTNAVQTFKSRTQREESEIVFRTV